MTGTEYQDLIDFLGEKFGRLETRLEVLAEHDRDQIQVLAEAVGSLNSKVDRFRADMNAEFAAVRSEMASGFQAQGELIRGLGARVDGLEARWN
jgi:phage host-nuclease inhibitor protein Gam